jgi:hypothetical protein
MPPRKRWLLLHDLDITSVMALATFQLLTQLMPAMWADETREPAWSALFTLSRTQLANTERLIGSLRRVKKTTDGRTERLEEAYRAASAQGRGLRVSSTLITDYLQSALPDVDEVSGVADISDTCSTNSMGLSPFLAVACLEVCRLGGPGLGISRTWEQPGCTV